jgi:hypothetical protein
MHAMTADQAVQLDALRKTNFHQPRVCQAYEMLAY